MNVYLLMVETEYGVGCWKVDSVYSSREAAQAALDGYVRLWDWEEDEMTIQCFEMK